ncbi:MAG: hypothetical protein KDD62_10580, partial [Bdellovibrionales bacterium]|nr:hypothetical protein [Bdellovibrionales bacterium]
MDHNPKQSDITAYSLGALHTQFFASAGVADLVTAGIRLKAFGTDEQNRCLGDNLLAQAKSRDVNSYRQFLASHLTIENLKILGSREFDAQWEKARDLLSVVVIELFNDQEKDIFPSLVPFLKQLPLNVTNPLITRCIPFLKDTTLRDSLLDYAEHHLHPGPVTEALLTIVDDVRVQSILGKKEYMYSGKAVQAAMAHCENPATRSFLADYLESIQEAMVPQKESPIAGWPRGLIREIFETCAHYRQDSRLWKSAVWLLSTNSQAHYGDACKLVATLAESPLIKEALPILASIAFDTYWVNKGTHYHIYQGYFSHSEVKWRYNDLERRAARELLSLNIEQEFVVCDLLPRYYRDPGPFRSFLERHSTSSTLQKHLAHGLASNNESVRIKAADILC